MGTKTWEINGGRANIISWIEHSRTGDKILNMTANPEPSEFLSEQAAEKPPWKRAKNGPKVVTTIGSLKASFEFRNIMELSPTIKCCDDSGETKLVDPGEGKLYDDGFSQTVGYTPQPGTREIGRPIYIEGHAGEPTREQKVDGSVPTCVHFTARARFRVNWFENRGQAALSGTLLPYAWAEIRMVVCCDGSSRLGWDGSIIPSHNVYWDDQLFDSYSMAGGRTQEKIKKFEDTAENDDAPAAPK